MSEGNEREKLFSEEEAKRIEYEVRERARDVMEFVAKVADEIINDPTRPADNSTQGYAVVSMLLAEIRMAVDVNAGLHMDTDDQVRLRKSIDDWATSVILKATIKGMVEGKLNVVRDDN